MRKRKILLVVLLLILVIAMLTACGGEDYTVTFMVDGEVRRTITINSKETTEVTLPTAPTKSGYTFVGWYLDSDFQLAFDEASVSASVTVYAKWKEVASSDPDEVITYTITFESNGGSEVGSITYNEGDTLTIPSNPTKAGYTFEGWYLDSGFETIFIDTTISTNIKVYAKWEAISYSITYELDGGTNAVGNPTTHTVESAEIALLEPTKVNYNFKGWYLDSSFETIFKDTTISTNITLYAKWEAIVLTIQQQYDAIDWDNMDNSNSYSLAYYVEQNECDLMRYVYELYYDVEPTDEELQSFSEEMRSDGFDYYEVTEDDDYYGQGIASFYCIDDGFIVLYELRSDLDEDTKSDLIETFLDAGYTQYGDMLYYGHMVSYLILQNYVVVGDLYISLDGKSVIMANNVEEIVIPYGITTIDSTAFENSTNLTSIVISDSVTSIGSRAFYNCTNLIINCEATSQPSGWDSSWNYSNCTVIWGYGGVEREYSFVVDGEVVATLVTIVVCEAPILWSINDIVENMYFWGWYDNAECIGEAVSFPYNSSEKTTLYAIFGSEIKVTEGLEYTLTGSEYSVTSIGTATETEIVIPSTYNGLPVTSIGAYAFLYCTNLTSVLIPDSVEIIYEDAFEYCTNLTSIIIPDSVTSIGAWAFQSCTSLTSVEIPDSVTIIDTYAFFNCSSLTDVNYNGSIEDWFNISFSHATSNPMYCASNCYMLDSSSNYNLLTELVIPDSITAIKDYTFYGFSCLTSVEILDSVTSIGTSAFSNCTNLTSVIIPDSVTSIGSDAFYRCINLTSVVIGDSVTSIGDYVFCGCSSLESMTLPFVGDGSSNTYFGYIFGDSSYLSSSTSSTNIPATLTSVTIIGGTISSCAFQYCTNLTSVVVGDSVTSIGTYAFYGCSSLESMTLPYVGDGSSNTYFGYIFGDSSYLSSSTSSTNIPATLTSVTIIGGTISSCAFQYCTNLTNVVIGDSVTSIGTYAFYGCSRLESITLPYVGDGSSNTYFGYIFGDSSYLSSSISSTNIPATLTSVTITGGTISSCAFQYCTNLTSVVIGDSVTSIGWYAFRYCTNLTSVTIGDSVTSIGKWAFSNCTNLTSVVIPDSVTSIGERAFYYCTSLTSVVIGDSVSSIGSDAFYRCTSLQTLTIGSASSTANDVSIGTYAFQYCTSLTNIYVYSNLTTTATSTSSYYTCQPFRYSGSNSTTTNLIIGDNVTSIGQYVFYYFSYLNTVTIGDSVTSIGTYAFGYCTSLTSVVIPDSVTSIGSYAFYYCLSLTSVVIGDSVTSIGYYAFRSCTNLISVTFSDTSTWYVTTSSTNWINKSGGYATTVASTSTAATYLKSTYDDYYWYKL